MQGSRLLDRRVGRERMLTVHADIENEVMHHPTQPSALKETVDAVQK